MRVENSEAQALMLVYNGLDHTRAEIAQKVNDDLGTGYSASDVSDTLNQIESEASAGNETEVFAAYLLEGVGASVGSELAPVVSVGLTNTQG